MYCFIHVHHSFLRTTEWRAVFFVITCTAVDDERGKKVVRHRLVRWNRSECWPWRARLALSYRARLYRPGCFSQGRQVDVCLLLCGRGGGVGLFDVVRVYRPGLFSRSDRGLCVCCLGSGGVSAGWACETRFHVRLFRRRFASASAAASAAVWNLLRNNLCLLPLLLLLLLLLFRTYFC